MAFFRFSQEHRCWAEVDLDALRHNLSVVRRHVGPDVRVLAVVKANAYGHGVAEVVHALKGQVEMFGVADLGEAIELRKWVPASRILLFSPALPSEREEIVNRGFVPTVSTFEEAAHYSEIHARIAGNAMDLIESNEAFSIHIDIDTGMGRVGVCEQNAVSTVGRIAELPGLIIAGISTHLPVADEDAGFTTDQLAGFGQLLKALSKKDLRLPIVHALNSAGLIAFREHAHGMVRAGLMLYGVSPIPEFQAQLKPVMTLKTRVALLRRVGPGRGISYGRTFVTRETIQVATLAAGYADGYPRHLSGRGAEVLIHGRRCSLLGRVTMDQIMVDVSRLRGVVVGDEVVLFGKQNNEEVSAAEVASKAQTIAWEIFTGIGPRVVRKFIERPVSLPVNIRRPVGRRN